MTDINDVPRVNELCTEQQQIQTAIYYLENGGYISVMVAAPSPTPPTVKATRENPMPIPPVNPMEGMLTVAIQMKYPTESDLLDRGLQALYERNEAINVELAALGVTGQLRAIKRA